MPPFSTSALLLLLLLFNTAVAGLLTVIQFGYGFWVNLLFSQCIGGCITLLNAPLILRMAPGWRRRFLMALGIPAGVLLGIGLAGWIHGQPMAPAKVLQSLAIGLMFGVLGSIVFLLAERIHALDREVRQRRLDEAERARREAEAHLKLLQAQIEPHFLFNTLANVASLIDTDPVLARTLLDRLNDWLRVALARARQGQACLDDELKLLENWLEILAIRFGSRLAWNIEASPESRRAPFPPMLLQPLLENAVKHGIEPKLGGGLIELTARLEAGRLRIRVRDDGAGLGSAATGTGLDNVRSRLAALYGPAGVLRVAGNDRGGVDAELELPCGS